MRRDEAVMRDSSVGQADDLGVEKPVGSRLLPGEAERLEASGAWTVAPLGRHLRNAVHEHPNRTAVVGFDSVTGERAALTYACFGDLVGRLRAGLSRLGLGAGDCVAIMLPNSIEFAALIWAVIEAGAVYSGIPSAYGEREAAFMLRRTKARALVVPAQYKDTDWIGLVRRLRAVSPNLEHIIVVGRVSSAGGFSTYDDLASTTTPDEVFEVNARSLVHIGFTSGTTGEPKGVMNSHQTLDAVMRNWTAHVGGEIFASGVVNLVASPVGHHTGFLWGVLLTPYVRGTAVFIDRWDPRIALDTVEREGVTMFIGAPTFLQDLVLARQHLGGIGSPLRMVAVAGAPIPRTLPATARQALGCFVCPAWGMTEYGIGISAATDHPLDRIDITDGVPVEGCEVRVVRADGSPAPLGTEGDLEMRGHGLFLGYFDRPDFTAEAFRNGWFQTGDRAVRFEDGHIALQGRSKDIVIRGGENVPVVEVETLLYQHPLILDAAVVGVPDPRLGERCAAVLVLRDGVTIDVTAVAAFLLERGLSKHFLPEIVEIVDRLPKTMSGKIKKAALRASLAARDATDPPDLLGRA